MRLFSQRFKTENSPGRIFCFWDLYLSPVHLCCGSMLATLSRNYSAVITASGICRIREICVSPFIFGSSAVSRPAESWPIQPSETEEQLFGWLRILPAAGWSNGHPASEWTPPKWCLADKGRVSLAAGDLQE